MVAGSRASAPPRSEIERPSRSQSASITRYCGCVRPSGSRIGRYSATTDLAASTAAKQSWLSSARGSVRVAPSWPFQLLAACRITAYTEYYDTR